MAALSIRRAVIGLSDLDGLVELEGECLVQPVHLFPKTKRRWSCSGGRRSENDVGRAAEQIGQELDHCCFESSSGNGENGLPQYHLVGAKIGSQSILAAHGFRE